VSVTSGKVGKRQIVWKTPPRGANGSGTVEIDGRALAVSWRSDRDGLWLETPEGIFGFDFEGERDDDGRTRYRVTQRGAAGEWEGLSFARAGEESASAEASGRKKSTRVRAQMPGKIIRVNIAAGAEVQKGQSLLVMEAMKMENEIKAPQAGKVSVVKVTEGQAVETGADLLVID
jgi:biotin carboxyl carrier protein